MNVLQIMKSEGLDGNSNIGRIGPYPLYVDSFEFLIENNKVSDERRPDVVAINTHTLTNILEGRTGARNHYFTKTKRNIFENKKEVVASYLECGNHWTFFTFAASKGYQGPWKRTKRNHSLQCDSISCGVFTAVFAEAFLEGSMGYLACSPVLQERARLGLFIFSSLDRSGICGICHRTASRKIKGKSSTCSVNIHTKCLPGNQEDAKC